MSRKIENVFMSGFVAAQYSLKFSPATNEGDYDWPFWLGFLIARMLQDIQRKWKKSDIYQYGEPEEIINRLREDLENSYRT